MSTPKGTIYLPQGYPLWVSWWPADFSYPEDKRSELVRHVVREHLDMVVGWRIDRPSDPDTDVEPMIPFTAGHGLLWLSSRVPHFYAPDRDQALDQAVSYATDYHRFSMEGLSSVAAQSKALERGWLRPVPDA